MEKLIIHGSRKHPSIVIDPENGMLEIKGNSIPEDAGAFYKPIVNKIEEYFYSPYPLTIVSINLNYYNSSTSKWLLTIFQILKKHNQNGHNIFVKWYYEDSDDASYDAAIDYCKLLNIPIKLLRAS